MKQMINVERIFILLKFLIVFASSQDNYQENHAFKAEIEAEGEVREYMKNLQGLTRVVERVYRKINPELKIPKSEDWIPEFRIRPTYDFIVVGSGPAGCVLAHRLSETPKWNVLLIEAGGYETTLMDVPIMAPGFQFTEKNWEYYAEPEPNSSLGLVNRRMHWPRGKVLGGSSSINYMMHTRGSTADFVKWHSQGRNPGWNFEEILPYYKKLENTTIENEDKNTHGHSGLLPVTNVYETELLKAYMEAAQELNIQNNIDYNSPKTPIGVGKLQGNLLNGWRHSASSAYLKTAVHRENLHILHSTYVTKVLIDEETKKAFGVEYERDGVLHRINVTKEVILSAGTFNSPQLLMLSGIGPKKHLEELGIKPLKNLPVGSNLQDHLMFPGLTFIINTTYSLTASKILSYDSIKDFLYLGEGPLSSPGDYESLGYIQTQYSADPDVELLFTSGSLATDYGLFVRRSMKISNKVFDGLLGSLIGQNTWTIIPVLLRPKSVGWLKLRSKNPKDFPILVGRPLSDADNIDVKAFISSIRTIQKLAKTKAFQKLGSTQNANVHPGCEKHIFDSDDYWECCLRSIAITIHHQVGTAKMGPVDDPTSVVSHQLKVHDVKNLRVADCSVIPFSMTAHTNAPSYLIGEKASDMIKDDWNE